MTSTKLTYRWAAGIVASNHIASLLIRLSKGEICRTDDIKTLYANLKNKTKNAKLKTFLTRGSGASRTRTKSATGALTSTMASRLGRRSSSPFSWRGYCSGLFRWAALTNPIGCGKCSCCIPF